MKTELLKASIWLLAGIAVLVFLLSRTVAIIQLMRAGASATAHVTETFDDEREDDRRVGIVTVAVYEFFVHDTRYFGKTEGPRGSFSVGDSIPIQYDPTKPSTNRAKGDRHELGNYLVILLFAGSFSCCTITINFPIIRRFFISANNPRREP
jgi:hypothetical protein